MTNPRGARTALDLDYYDMSTEGKRLYWRLASVHPGPDFDPGAAAALLARPGESAEDAQVRAFAAVDGLSNAQVLGRSGAHGSGRLQLRDGVRQHALGRAAKEEPPSARKAALRRLCDHYLLGATRAEKIIDPQHRTMDRNFGPGPLIHPALSADGSADTDVDDVTALDWLELELPVLMRVLRLSRREKLHTIVWQLADAMWPLFLHRKHYDSWREAHRLGLESARDLGDAVAQCRMLTSGGIGEIQRAPEQALTQFEEAARLFAALNDRLGLARTLNYRGRALGEMGQIPAAASFFQQAAAELPRLGDPRAGGLAHYNLARLAVADGRPRDALPSANQAHSILSASGDVYNGARAAALLGEIYVLLDNAASLDAAEVWLGKALEVQRARAADYETARVLETLGKLAERRGQPGWARECYTEAAVLYRASGHDPVTVQAALRRLPKGRK